MSPDVRDKYWWCKWSKQNLSESRYASALPPCMLPKTELCGDVTDLQHVQRPFYPVMVNSRAGPLADWRNAAVLWGMGVFLVYS